jgi:hypothetical protein
MSKKISELKPFKVTYKTTSGKESTCTIKARDEKEAKAKCRSKPNYAGNAVVTLKEAKKYNVTTRGGKTLGTVSGNDAGEAMVSAKRKFSSKVGKGDDDKLICKPIKESQLTEGVLDDVDDDGFMAKRQLYDLAKYSVELHRMIQDTDDLEPWIQAKITKAADYIDTVKHYLEYSGVRDAEATADVMGPPELDDIDAVGSELDTMMPQEEVMEYGDEDDGSEVHPEDVLRWASNRGVISDEQYDNPSPELMGAAQDTADWIGTVYEIGSSDISIWLRDFVDAAKGSGAILDGERAHLYESQLKAKMIYRNMLRELREKK